MSLIATTRFNDETFAENNKYKESKGMGEGCLYGQRMRIKEKVLLNTQMFVVEMNNQTNKIEGIGLIRNLIVTDKYYKVYENSDFNRYIYKGTHRMSREELCGINEALVECIERMCFKGKTHLKRLPGITVVSDKLLASSAPTGLIYKKEIKDAFTIKYRGELEC